MGHLHRLRVVYSKSQYCLRDYEMNFPPAELEKEARSEVLTHLREGWAQVGISYVMLHPLTQFSLSCYMNNSFSRPPCPNCQSALVWYILGMVDTLFVFLLAYKLRLSCAIHIIVSQPLVLVDSVFRFVAW